MAKKLKKQAPTPFKFYGEKDFLADQDYAREFSNQDAIAIITLYRIDSLKSVTSSIYGEAKAKDKKFLTPISLNVTMEMDKSENEYMAEVGINRENINMVKFGVYKDELDEKNVSINRGDYFKYFDGEKYRNFEITAVSNVNSNNSMIGYKPYFITCEATMVLNNVVLD
jgi:hypothetical protein